jgi:phosphoribosylamine--glycine ligase
VVEEFLHGQIGSVFALSDGKTSLMFGAAQDHKRVFDGDRGPNTGGMGAYAPAPILSAGALEAVRAQLIEPALDGMKDEGAPYRGALFCETMITAGGPRLIEFNARFGDPECQVLMMRLEDDLAPYLLAVSRGGLAELSPPRWRAGAAICVVLAARGYPGVPQTGGLIEGAEADFGPDVTVFHAGTVRRDDGALIASGGRVLNVCARGSDLTQARAAAYDAIDRIRFPDGFCRRDIGWRALNEQSDPVGLSPGAN